MHAHVVHASAKFTVRHSVKLFPFAVSFGESQRRMGSYAGDNFDFVEGGARNPKNRFNFAASLHIHFNYTYLY